MIIRSKMKIPKEYEEKIRAKQEAAGERIKYDLPGMRTIILVAVLTLLFFAAGVRFGDYLEGRNDPLPVDTQTAGYCVDVKGAVAKPGLYTVPAGSRIENLLAELEFTADAAPELLNRAAYITDGSELIIPSRGAGIDWDLLAQQRGGVYYGQPESSSSSSGNNAAFTGVININTAGAEELDMLPNIGPAKAQAIIEHRNTHGAFLTKEQIMNVTGIGQATYDKIKDNISI